MVTNYFNYSFIFVAELFFAVAWRVGAGGLETVLKDSNKEHSTALTGSFKIQGAHGI